MKRGKPINQLPNFKEIASEGGKRSAELRRQRKARQEEAKNAAYSIVEIRPPYDVLVKTGLVDYVLRLEADAKAAGVPRPKVVHRRRKKAPKEGDETNLT